MNRHENYMFNPFVLNFLVDYKFDAFRSIVRSKVIRNHLIEDILSLNEVDIWGLHVQKTRLLFSPLLEGFLFWLIEAPSSSDLSLTWWYTFWKPWSELGLQAVEIRFFFSLWGQLTHLKTKSQPWLDEHYLNLLNYSQTLHVFSIFQFYAEISG